MIDRGRDDALQSTDASAAAWPAHVLRGPRTRSPTRRPHPEHGRAAFILCRPVGPQRQQPGPVHDRAIRLLPFSARGGGLRLLQRERALYLGLNPRITEGPRVDRMTAEQLLEKVAGGGIVGLLFDLDDLSVLLPAAPD